MLAGPNLIIFYNSAPNVGLLGLAWGGGTHTDRGSKAAFLNIGGKHTYRGYQIAVTHTVSERVPALVKAITEVLIL